MLSHDPLPITDAQNLECVNVVRRESFHLLGQVPSNPHVLEKPILVVSLQVSKMVLKRLSTSTMFVTIRSATQKLVHRQFLTQQVFQP